jgi:pimeloyl-ACP methyl ester carboxylesterase
MSARLEIKLLQDDGVLRVWFYKGQSDRLTVCFAGIGSRDGTPQEYEFAKAATHDGRDSALFFADTGRTWLNHPGQIEEIVNWVEAMKRDIGATQIVTLGHSMGGFSALALPHFTKVDVAVGMSPQFSVHPDVVPDDGRWMWVRRNLTSYRIRDLGDLFEDATAYYIFHGAGPAERPQRSRFPVARNLKHFIVEGGGHQVPRFLRKRNLMGEVIEHAFNDRPRRVRLALAPVGGRRRPVPRSAPKSDTATQQEGPATAAEG